MNVIPIKFRKVISLMLALMLWCLSIPLGVAADSSAAAPDVFEVYPRGDNVIYAAAGKITFDSAMMRSTLTSDNIIITNETNGKAIVEQKKSSAYDDAYTFVCDFEPATKYKVTVTTNVKSADGVNMASDYVYTFETSDELDVANDVTPKELTSYTHNAEKCSGSTSNALVDVFDGKKETKWYAFGDPTGKYIDIDLGRIKNIAYISLAPGLPTDDLGWASDIQVLGSIRPDYSKYDELAITPTLTTEDNYATVDWCIVPHGNEKYRYLRIYKNSKNISLAEINIFAYSDDPNEDPSEIYGEPRLVNVALNKPVTYNEELGIYNNATDTYVRVNDGVTTPSNYVAFNPGSSSDGETSYFTIDLLKPYKVDQIAIFTRSGNAKSDTDNLTIYGSNSLVPSSKMNVIYECPDGFTPSSKNTVDVGGKYYRYIKFEKVANGHFCLSEVQVNCLTDINYNQNWSVVAEDDTFYYLQLDKIDNSGETKNLMSVTTSYDEDGKLALLDISSQTIAKGTGKQIFVMGEKSAGMSNVSTILISSLEDFKVEFAPSNPSTELKGKEIASVDLDSSETAAFVILKPGRSFVEEIDESDILYLDFKIADENGKAKFGYDFSESDGTGAFSARVYITHADGTVSIETFTFYYYTQEAFDDMTEAFMAVSNSSEFAGKLEYYTEINPHFSLDDIPELKNNAVSKEIGDDFIKVRDLFLKDSGTSPDDVVYALKTAYVLYSARTQSDKTALEKYGDMVKDYDDKKHDDEKVLTMLYRLAENITDGESFEKTCIDACIYSLMINADVEALADVLKEYSEELGIDISAAEKKKVSATDVAKKLDSKNPEKYVGNMAEIFARLVDEIYEERREIQSDKVDRGTGKGGSSGGGGSVFHKTDKVEIAPVPTETPDEEVEKNNLFADTAQMTWANDAICALAEKNIISGVDGVNFMPERAIKREEFSKMISLAFSLKREEGKMSRFVDCEKEAWYYPYVDALYGSGIINGISGDEFGVGAYISRQDAATILARVAESYNKKLSKDELSYSDASSVAEYAKDAISKLDKAGIITGFEDGSFKPLESITRAQAAVMIYRMMQYVGA